MSNRQTGSNGWRRSKWVASLCAIAVGFSALPAHAADTAREKIAQGKTHFDQGRYEEALKSFDEVGEADDPTLNAELLHDRAAAQFKLGKLDEARELWVRASSLRDPAFEASCSYNLGNCDYADALNAVSAQNTQGALEALEKSRTYYRDALRLDPQLTNARANLELANQLIQKIKEQASTQPQSQQQSQPSSDQQKGDQDQQQNQNSSQPSSQSSDDQQNQQGDQQNDSQDQDQKNQQQSGDQQKEDQKSKGEQESQSQPSPQTQPGEQQQGDEQQAQSQPVPIEMTKEQAERLLQMIRDAEKERRAVLKARERGRYKPVDKDW